MLWMEARLDDCKSKCQITRGVTQSFLFLKKWPFYLFRRMQSIGSRWLFLRRHFWGSFKSFGFGSSVIRDVRPVYLSSEHTQHYKTKQANNFSNQWLWLWLWQAGQHRNKYHPTPTPTYSNSKSRLKKTQEQCHAPSRIRMQGRNHA